MHTTSMRRGTLVTILLAATLGMSACVANKPPTSAGPGNGHTVAPAATTTPTHAASPPVVTPGATPAVPGGVHNMVISSAERGELTAAFVDIKGISVSDVGGGGPRPGTVYYAYDPTTDTYWALAQFEPSSTASFDVQVGFQDGRGVGMFRKSGAGPWQAQLVASIPFSCNEVKFFPPEVLMIWGLPTSLPAGMTPSC
jgi:hypothetical protein